MVYVFTGTQRQADACIKALGLDHAKARYISRPETILGVHQPHVLRAGTYHERRDRKEIEDAIASVSASVQDIR